MSDKPDKKSIVQDKSTRKKNSKNELSPQSFSKTNPEFYSASSLEQIQKSSKLTTRHTPIKKKKADKDEPQKTSPLFDVAQFYKREKGKINIWTYLFRMLNKSITDIYNMCEIENKQEYVMGVIETVENAMQSFQKLKHKLSIESLNKEEIKNVSWEVQIYNPSEMLKASEIEHFIEDLEEPENIDFTLITQLIEERKMTFDEAIVLLIRERADQIDELSITTASQNNSFSKYSYEILEALRDFKDDSLMARDEDGESNGKRSRSVTPSRVSLSKMMSRLTWRLNKNLEIKEEDENGEEREVKEQFIKEKQERAEKLRKSLEKNKQDFINKEKEKSKAAKERLEKKKKEQDKIQQDFSKKMDQADQRYEAHIHRIKNRAKNQITKTHEIAFITMLEAQSQRIIFDEKLNECRERKLKIIQQIKEKQSLRSVKEEAVEKRRQALAQEVHEQHKLQQAKLESAESRRLKILEEKKKKFEDINKEKISISEKKKIKDIKKEDKNQTKTILDKKKQSFLKDKAKFDRLFKKNVTKLDSPNSSFLTIESSEGEDSRLCIKKVSRLKMNSHSNSPEFNFCSDEDYSVENSILFCESKKSLLDAVSSEISKNQNFEKNNGAKPKKFRKKKKARKQKIFKNEEKSPEIEKEIIVSRSMPNLLVCRDYSKSDHIFIRLGLKSTLCRAKQGLIYPRIKQKITSTSDLTTSKNNDKNENNQKSKEKGLEKREKEKVEKKGLNNSLKNVSTLKNKGPVGRNIKVNEKNEEKRENNEEEKENVEGTVRWCSICNQFLEDNVTNNDHLNNKTHKKQKGLYALSQNDDQNCIMNFQSGDPDNEELKAKRIDAFRKRCKKIKQSLNLRALKHESSILSGKEISSTNKLKLQKLCMELDKQLIPQIKDYSQLENYLKEISKILEGRKEADLHIMRQLKFIPLLMEICKKITVCHKSEVNDVLRVLDSSSNLLALFCNLSDNRTYMIATNRLIPLVDLLFWCLNQPTKFVYTLVFVPIIFGLLASLLKHRVVNTEFGNFNDDVVEYIFNNGILLKIKQKFMSFNGGLDLSTGMGKVPLALLKSVNFLETLTAYLGVDICGGKPVYEPFKLNESILFVLKESELIGIINLMVSLLLSEGSCGKIPGKLMPQTVLSLSMVCLKFLNNVARLNLDILQKCTSSKMNDEMIYHIFNYLLTYCKEYYDNSDDVKDLLNELILLIGYNSLLNERNQEYLSRGEQTIIQKLAGLPIAYICDKKLKDILFPTMLCCIFKNERNLQILLQEMSKELLVNYLNSQIQLFPYENGKPMEKKEALKKIEEKDIKDKSADKSINKGLDAEEKKENEEGIYTNIIKYIKESRSFERKEARSLSFSSTNSSQNSSVVSSSQHFLFPLRFPRLIWEDTIEFINN